MEGQELLFFSPSLSGRQRGPVSQHTLEMMQTGGMRLSRYLVHHQAPLGSPGPCPRVASPCQQQPSCPTQPRPASARYPLGDCGFKAQIFLLMVLLFKDRELTATVHTQQSGGRSEAMEAAGNRALQGSHSIF